MYLWSFPGGLVVKNPPAVQETWVQSLVWKDPLEKEMATGEGNPVFLPGKSHGKRSLAGYSPWCCKRVGPNLATKQQQYLQITEASVQFSRSVMSSSLQPHELQHTSLPCPSLTPEVCSNLCPLIQRCYPTISSSVVTHPSPLTTVGRWD